METSSLTQWQTRYISFSNDVENLSVDNSEQQSLVINIKANEQRMKTVFDSIVSIAQNQSSHETVSALQISWSRMSIQSQTVVADSTRLSQLLSIQVDQLNSINYGLILGIIGIFSLFLVATYIQIFGRTLKSISDLQAGTAVIGSGDLNYKIENNRKDEIGELSRSFNQMTANLKTANGKLKDSERLAAIGATAGMVGHDIRNPLQAITSDAYLAKTELSAIPDSEEKKNAIESIEEIEKNTEYINKIVQDLQDYSRPLNPKAEESDLKLIFEKMFTKNGLPKNIKVNVKVDDAARKINADSYYINRIMYNLVTNAIQAMPNGGKLTIQAQKEADDTVISVKDTGVGIPKDVQSKMFTVMFTTKSKGQGFGLPVVKRMTESLGGMVTFESDEGKGTTFVLRLPPQRFNR